MNNRDTLIERALRRQQQKQTQANEKPRDKATLRVVDPNERWVGSTWRNIYAQEGWQHDAMVHTPDGGQGEWQNLNDTCSRIERDFNRLMNLLTSTN